MASLPVITLSFEALSFDERASWTSYDLGRALNEVLDALRVIKDETIKARMKMAEAKMRKARGESDAAADIDEAKLIIAAMRDQASAVREYKSILQTLTRAIPG